MRPETALGYRAQLKRGETLDLDQQRTLVDEMIRTIWIEIESEGFAYHDYGGELDSETYYIPTRKRLDENKGSDWY